VIELLGVWDVPAALSAIVGGIGVGYVVVGSLLRNPRYSAGLASVLEYLRIVASSSVLVFGVFFIGQTLAAWAKGDPLWWRVASRFTIAIVYCVCIGVGAAVSALRDNRKRSQAARSRVLEERR